jgi:uncharacterized membrane protein (UPF0182 family)
MERAAAPEPAPGTESAAELARQASQTYQRAVAAQRAGDWARYGEEWSRLSELLKQLEKATAREP